MNPVRVGIVDYGMGNRRSVEKALLHVGADAVVSRDHAVLRECDGLILPGVGAFPRAMGIIRELGHDTFLRERVDAGVPVLGICLGMQLLFDGSEELGGAEGLGLLRGAVRRLAPADGERVPHIGWNLVTWTGEHPLLAGFGAATAFYHVHSFAAHPAEPADVLGRGDHGGAFVSAVARDRVAGVQFHPEKSSGDGLALLASFRAECAAPVAA